jgi:predicted ATPase/signal transduction histidine kinase
VSPPPLTDYDLASELASCDAQIGLWRGLRRSDQRPVLLKLLNAPSQDAVAWLRREHHILSQLSLEGVSSALDLLHEGERWGLVLDDRGSSPLSPQSLDGTLSLEHFLEIASGASRVLASLHNERLTHRRICPGAILVDPATWRVELTDLSQASPLNLPVPTEPGWEPGFLPYMSPEHTGRIGRALDHRSDLYGLGATLYHVLTGSPPFAGEDAASVIHAHVARAPQSPVSRRSDTPAVVARILLRLLAKPPEDRYQSAHALSADFERALRELRERGTVHDFPIGARDRDRHLRLPNRLFGREVELATLGKLWRSDVPERRLVLATGPAGIGKSAFVHAQRPLVLEAGGRFARGKFDQLSSDVLYGALGEALRSLTRQLLAQPEAPLRQTQRLLQRALGQRAQALLEVVPELGTLLEEQLPLAPLGALEAEHRFHALVLGFLRVLASPKRPLVIFLDDLQWAQPPSLRLLELLLLDEELEGLVVFGAYRDNEVLAGAPLLETLGRLGEVVPTTALALGPLKEADVAEFLCAALGRSQAEVEPLAHLIHGQTEGNPFEVREQLRGMHAQGLLNFDEALRVWAWDLEQIAGSEEASDIIEFLLAGMGRLSERGRELVRLAACIGNTFRLETLAVIAEVPPEQLDQELGEVAQALFIQPAVPRISITSREGDPVMIVPRYAFRHDRIQQAAHALVPLEDRARTHLRIGRLLAESLRQGEGVVNTVEVATQLNAGRALISERSEREDLAELNRQAAVRARESTSWTDAQGFIRIAWDLLDDSSPLPLLYAVAAERAHIEYLNGEGERVREVVAATLPRIEDPLQRASLLDHLVILGTAEGRFAEAISWGRRALADLGVTLPEEDLERELEEELEAIHRNRVSRSYEELAQAPGMTDPVTTRAVRILVNLDSPSYLSDPALYAVVVCKMANLTLAHGPVSESSKAYASLGIVLTSLGRYEEALRYAELGIALSERFADKGQECRACHTLANHVLTWVRPARGTDAINERGYQAGYFASEILWCGFIQLFKLYNRFFAGRALPEILDAAREGLEFCERTGNQPGIDSIHGIQLTLRSLTGQTSEEEHSAFVAECRAKEGTFALALYLCVQGEAELIAGNPERALQICEEARPLLPAVLGVSVVAGHNLTESLAAIDLLLGELERSATERTELAALVSRNQVELRRWADGCPANFECRWLLVEGARLQLEGELLEASRCFDRAAELAEVEGFVQISAQADERQAKLWAALDKPELQRLFQERAGQAYLSWGATSKRALRRPSDGVQRGGSISGLDVESLLKASRAISGELVRSRLLPRMLEILGETTGAEWGFLIVDGPADLEVEASWGPGGSSVKRIPLSEQPEVAEGVVRYAWRTAAEVVLPDASSAGPFVDDPVVSARRIRSLLAAPLIAQGRVRGVLYLANELVPGVFAEDRLQVLRLLLPQVTTSLANAELFAELEARTEALRADVAIRERTEQERGQLEREVRQLQRMDAVGTLATGIAHDFNNLLQVIFGNTALARHLNTSPEVAESLEEISRAGAHARNLVAQILSFGRPGKAWLDYTDLRTVAEEALGLLTSSARPNVELVASLPPEAALVEAHATQLHQVVMNLCTNALQAIGSRGRLEVSVEALTLAEPRRVGEVVLSPGPYHLLQVSDDGVGMSEATAAQVFSAFFTTKEHAGGTGLGLPVVRRIVQGSRGAVEVESALGQGTTFRVYLPAASGEREADLGPEPLRRLGSGQRILCVDDEESITRLTQGLLSALGFEAHTLNESRLALEVLKTNPTTYEVLILDVRMPDMSGVQLARAAARTCPDLPILLLTAEGTGEEDQLLEEGVVRAVLRKPITGAGLAAAVGQALGLES